MKKNLALAIGLALSTLAPSAFAITDEEGSAALQFNLAPPGARSLGMGGAFIGLADDATAAASNPAGLLQLAAPEVSVEFRNSGYDTPYVDGGSYSSSPFSTDGLNISRDSENVGGFSFLSFVYPQENWALAFYRQEALNFKTSFVSAGADDSASTGFIFPFAAAAQLRDVVYGVSGAFRFNDYISAGVSINTHDFDIDSATLRTFQSNGSTVNLLTTQDGNSNAIGGYFGLMVKPNDQWQFGFTYRAAPEFKYDAAAYRNGTQFLSKTTKFDSPDAFGLGAVWRPSEQLSLALDVVQVRYSELTDNMVSNFQLNDALPVVQEGIGPLEIDDGVEVHLGGEYVFTNFNHPFSIRAGLWHDPEHSIRFEGQPIVRDVTDAVANAVLFSQGDDELHYAFGFGWAFEKFQVDAGADFSENVDTWSVSGVWRF